MIAVRENLGVGIYTPAEAARYARIPPQTFNRWFFGDKVVSRVVHPHFDDERVISFHDFVQSLAIRNVRVYHHVPLAKIREGIDRAQQRYGVKYPLARRKKIYLYGTDLYIDLEEEGLQKLTGRNLNQRVIKPVLEVYMRDLGFEPGQALATYYDAWKWSDRTIRMNPDIRFGEPIVLSCGYSARTLWEGCMAEGSIEGAAEAYGVEPADVDAAFRYCDMIQGRQVA